MGPPKARATEPTVCFIGCNMGEASLGHPEGTLSGHSPMPVQGSGRWGGHSCCRARRRRHSRPGARAPTPRLRPCRAAAQHGGLAGARECSHSDLAASRREP